MDGKTRTFINDLAQNVIDSFQIRIPIENMDEVVRALGGVIEESVRVSENQEFLDFSDGSVSKTDNAFKIVVSPFQSPERRNFTVAHELGHLFLHMGYIIDEDKWSRPEKTVYRRAGNSELEYQANEFAAAFLMPVGEYKTIVERYTSGEFVNTQEVAEYFGVSPLAASNRGKFLGVLEW